MAKTYARLINQYKCICEVVFSTSFDKPDEIDQVFDEIEFYNNLNLGKN